MLNKAHSQCGDLSYREVESRLCSEYRSDLNVFCFALFWYRVETPCEYK